MMRRLELPGRAPGPYRRGGPLLAACVAAVLTVGMSSVRLPAVEPARDGVTLRVDRAWRAEFFPGAGRDGVRRSSIWRVTATLGRGLSTSAPWYLVVGPDAGAPDVVDAAAIEGAVAEALPRDSGHPTDSDIIPRHPGGRRHPIGAPDWRDAAGWNAWRLHASSPLRRTLALSLDAATVDTLGRWVGLFDASGHRVAIARLDEAGR
ncbi:MAG TPA: hypothetical protein VF720_04335 [Candidatus Eisenbacteria bacterium]